MGTIFMAHSIYKPLCALCVTELSLILWHWRRVLFMRQCLGCDEEFVWFVSFVLASTFCLIRVSWLSWRLWFVLCWQTSQRVCVKQPSLARSLIQDSESELAVAGGQVLPECKVVELRTQLPFVMAHLTITARYIFLCTCSTPRSTQHNLFW